METLDQEPIGNAQMSLLGQNKVHIKFDQIDYGSYRITSSDSVVLAFGSRTGFMNHLMTLQGHEIPKKVWSFTYRNPSKSSFVIVLYKYKFFGKNEEIGEIELKLSGFHENLVTTHTFPLKSSVRGTPPSVTLTVHISEDQSPPFESEKIPSNTTFH